MTEFYYNKFRKISQWSEVERRSSEVIIFRCEFEFHTLLGGVFVLDGGRNSQRERDIPKNWIWV